MLPELVNEVSVNLGGNRVDKYGPQIVFGRGIALIPAFEAQSCSVLGYNLAGTMVR
jgi:hypothetical protein